MFARLAAADVLTEVAVLLENDMTFKKKVRYVNVLVQSTFQNCRN